MKHDIQNMRQSYEQAALDFDHTDESPFKQFHKWFDQAVKAEVPEPNALILATVSNNGQPSSRTMLLKGLDDTGFVFFTNYASRKGMEIAQNPKAAILFLWMELERQVRIEGSLQKLSSTENDEYFYTRPLGSRIGAIASPQSQIIESRTWLETQVSDLQNETNPKRPENWGGFRLIPNKFEYWQGRPNRLHDRIEYIPEGEAWKRHRLAP